jgi:hypothetical protein
MRKRLILLIAVVFLSMTGLAQAATNELHGTIDATYTSKYVWRGFTIFGQQSGIHPGIDLDLYGTGFGFSAVGHMANSSGYELNQRWDYTLYYGNKLYESEPYAINYRLSYVYYNYPQRSSHSTSTVGATMDLQELNSAFSFPNLLGVEGLVPSYVLVKLWPSNSGSSVGERHPAGGSTASGFAHIFMLDYGWVIPAIVPNTAEQVLDLHGEVVYNDGVCPNGARNVDHDWSNAVFGVSTDFPICKDLVFTPGVYHQVTMDKSVNDDKSITWARASLTYKF